jgi:hypothetical protein
MPEYRSLFDLPPSVLTREDIVALAKLLEAGIPLNPHSIQYTAKTGEASYRAKSINDLLSQLPGNADQFYLGVNGWTDDNSIDRGVSIMLHATVPSSFRRFTSSSGLADPGMAVCCRTSLSFQAHCKRPFCWQQSIYG